jgi:hypothetical protein
VLSSEAEKYHDYARECIRLAEQAKTAEHREKLLDLSRAWMEAALTEEEYAQAKERASG